MRKNVPSKARQVAFGGVFAALALVIMCLGGFIPIATYACPVLCLIIMAIVCSFTSKQIGWIWYAAVSILSVLLSPDKEAAVIFVFMGPYPIIRQRVEHLPFPFLWKLLYFNVTILLAYSLLLRLMGLYEIADEFASLGKYGAWILLLAGNGLFLMVDKLLGMRFSGGKSHG